MLFDPNKHTTSLQRHDVAATLLRHCVFAVMWLSRILYTDESFSTGVV